MLVHNTISSIEFGYKIQNTTLKSIRVVVYSIKTLNNNLIVLSIGKEQKEDNLCIDVDINKGVSWESGSVVELITLTTSAPLSALGQTIFISGSAEIRRHNLYKQQFRFTASATLKFNFETRSVWSHQISL